MSTPATTLDPRFSDPGATAAGWARPARCSRTPSCPGSARSAPTAARTSPRWWPCGWTGRCTSAPAAGEQKAVNLRGNPHVLLLTGCHRWDDGLDVVAEGDAVQVTDEALLTRLAREWARKWDGQWQFQVRDGGFWHPGGGAAQVFEVRPAKVLAFAKGRFGQTRYRFS